MSTIDEQLHKLAVTDWEQFMEIVGEDTLLIAKARLLRIAGKSYQQISIKLSMSPMQVRHACKKVKADKK